VTGPKIMVVEDDLDLRGVLLRGLEEEGFRTVGAGSGAELLDRIGPEAPDLLIVDIGLPDADGRDVCQALRAQGMHLPILFLSARAALTDRVTGFSAGGDDYVTKPFAFAELVQTGWPHGARVRDNTLDAYVARLRRKLAELPDAPRITTVHGVGYTLE
jgi:two-component system response regulator MprA